MCDTLSDLRAGLSSYAAGFDAALLSAEQAASAVEAATAVERMASAVKAKAAARVAECRRWKGAGERSAAHELARSTGTTVGQAAETLQTVKRLNDLPVLDAAARAGELSGSRPRPSPTPPPPIPRLRRAWWRRPRGRRWPS